MTPPIAPMAVGPSVTQKVTLFTLMVSLDPHIVSLDSIDLGCFTKVTRVKTLFCHNVQSQHFFGLPEVPGSGLRKLTKLDLARRSI